MHWNCHIYVVIIVGHKQLLIKSIEIWNKAEKLEEKYDVIGGLV